MAMMILLPEELDATNLPEYSNITHTTRVFFYHGGDFLICYLCG